MTQSGIEPATFRLVAQWLTICVWLSKCAVCCTMYLRLEYYSLKTQALRPLTASDGWLLGARAKLRKKKLSALSRQAVRPSAWTNSAPTTRIFMKLDI